MDWLTHALSFAQLGALAAQFKSEIADPAFWVSLTKIIWINVLLSGDNALVIAVACSPGRDFGEWCLAPASPFCCG